MPNVPFPSYMRMRRLLLPALIVAMTLCPLLLTSDYLRFVAVMILINAIAATGVNLSMGFCGLVSVGHAGFLGIGAYAAALLINYFSSNALVAVLAGGVSAGVAGIVIGLPSLRLNPLYIAMVTFGFGQAVNLVAINWIKVTGGPNGLGVNAPMAFGIELGNTALYVSAALVFMLCLWVSACIKNSRLGRAFLAVKESEIAAKSMGIAVDRYKIIAFTIGAGRGRRWPLRAYLGLRQSRRLRLPDFHLACDHVHRWWLGAAVRANRRRDYIHHSARGSATIRRI
jgi:branched-chain amino acid transport system permease protein